MGDVWVQSSIDYGTSNRASIDFTLPVIYFFSSPFEPDILGCMSCDFEVESAGPGLGQCRLASKGEKCMLRLALGKGGLNNAQCGRSTVRAHV